MNNKLELRGGRIEFSGSRFLVWRNVIRSHSEKKPDQEKNDRPKIGVPYESAYNKG